MQNFTNNDLLLYIFNETSPDQTQQITQTLKQHEGLRQKVFQMNTLMDEIDSLQLEPDNAIIDSILAHFQTGHEIHIV
jgi:predicted ATP-dependent serine protease